MALINPRNVSSLDFSSSLPCSIPSSFSSPSFLPIPPPFDAATNCFKARDTDSTDRLRLISLVPPLLTHPVRSSCSCSRHFPLFRSPPALILLTRRRSAELRGGKGEKRWQWRRPIGTGAEITNKAPSLILSFLINRPVSSFLQTLIVFAPVSRYALSRVEFFQAGTNGWLWRVRSYGIIEIVVGECDGQRECLTDVFYIYI